MDLIKTIGISELIRDSLKKTIFIIGILIYGALFISLPSLYFVRLGGYLWRDSLFVLKEYIHGPQKSKDTVVVAIDEPSFKEIGLRWPWPRSIHARLVEALEKHGAKVIAFDILFSEPSRDPQEDDIFANTVGKYNNIVLGFAYSLVNRKNFIEQIEVPPIQKLGERCNIIGLLNFYPDEDGVIRQGRIVVNQNYTLAAGAVVTALKGKEDTINICPDPFVIRFSGANGGVETVSYYQALEPDKYLPKNFFKDKMVFVGFASEAAVEVERGAVDAFPTPFFRITRKLMYGVKIHANAAQTLLDRCPLRELDSRGIYTFLIFLLCSVGGYFFRKRAIGVVLYPLIAIVVVIVTCFILFEMNRIYIPFHAVLGFVCSHSFWAITEYSISAREKKFLRRAFSLYVPKELVNVIVRDPHLLRLGGERKEISILFSDIRDFTSFSERTSPEKLVRLLNEYLSDMTEEVFIHGGTLDKYIGDAIMALFGAPVYFEDHADRACKTALGMIKRLKAVSLNWKKEGIENLRIGIGVHTGEVIVGNLGSHQRFDYTAVGDNVNLASRLEGLSKIYNVPIILSESTVKGVKGKFFFRELDIVRVKGKKEPVRIFTLYSEDEYNEDLILMYEEILEVYRKGDFKRVILKCKELLKLYPNDGPTSVILNRSVLLLKESPSTWSGIWDIGTK